MSETTQTRRTFLQGATTAAGAAALASSIGSRAYAAGEGTLKVGLIGCGGRGTGAAVNALSADPGTKLVAMSDTFADRIEGSLNTLQRNGGVKDRVEVDDDHKFDGLDGYKGVIDSVDVVCMATPPHFRPMHLKYAVEKGVHSFVEKPVATDGPHLRDIYETCQVAEKKNLAVVSGLCWRYHQPKVETMQRVLDGEIGDIVAIETVYNTGTLWHRGRQPQWSEMEYQIRNWLYFTWLSGDHIAEQAIHSIDKMGWAMRDELPKVCWGVGGRQVRTGEQYGNIYDHFSLVYEYANGVRGYHQCRQMSGTKGRVRDYIFGTKGVADVFGHSISGEKAWRYRGPSNDMYQTEHEAMFKSIRDGKPINNGVYMCRSTMLAIMGRMAAYTGDNITWENAWNSQENLAPERYEWGPAPQRPVAMPGQTKFV